MSPAVLDLHTVNVLPWLGNEDSIMRTFLSVEHYRLDWFEVKRPWFVDVSVYLGWLSFMGAN